jgi:N-acetylmuramoyl-L-alanine amidase
MLKRFLLLITATLGFMVSAHAFTVVLDAGHGGQDAGAVGAFSKEKNINLRYTLAVGDLIKKNHPDVKVIYTRNKDVFVNLNERARIANKAKADLFISIHTNASKNRSANGMETFTLGVSRSKENMEVAMLENSVILLEDDYEKKYEGFDPNSTDSYIMFEFMKDQYMERSITCADLIQQNMITASKRNNRGVRQAGFLVLRATTMPSVLIELGFISNKEEEKYLNDTNNQAKICKAIYQAFANYKHDIDKRNGKEEGASSSGASTSSATEESQKSEGQKSKVEGQSKVSAEDKTVPEPVKSLSKVSAEDKTVPELVESLSEPSAESSLLELSRGEAKDIKGPSFGDAEANKVESQKSEVEGQKSEGEGALTGAASESPLEFYWQILVSKNNYPLNHAVFKGVSIGNVIHENQLYKYLIGPAYSMEDIEKRRSYVKNLFPDAFIVTYKNGERITYQP